MPRGRKRYSEETKVCTGCKKELYTDRFPRDNKGWLHGACRTCRKEIYKRYFRKKWKEPEFRAAKLAKAKAWREKNKERYLRQERCRRILIKLEEAGLNTRTAVVQLMQENNVVFKKYEHYL
jgi:hypothetical protein